MSSGCYNSCHCDVCESIETMYVLVLYSTLAKLVIVAGIMTMAVAVTYAGDFIAAATIVHECVRIIDVNADGDGGGGGCGVVGGDYNYGGVTWRGGASLLNCSKTASP